MLQDDGSIRCGTWRQGQQIEAIALDSSKCASRVVVHVAQPVPRPPCPDCRKGTGISISLIQQPHEKYGCNLVKPNANGLHSGMVPCSPKAPAAMEAGRKQQQVGQVAPWGLAVRKAVPDVQTDIVTIKLFDCGRKKGAMPGISNQQL